MLEESKPVWNKEDIPDIKRKFIPEPGNRSALLCGETATGNNKVSDEQRPKKGGAQVGRDQVEAICSK